MRADVDVQINQLERLAYSRQRRLGNRLRLAREGDDRAVVVGVHFAVQHKHARHAAHGRHNRIHLGGVAPFGKIRHAFNQAFHLSFAQ